MRCPICGGEMSAENRCEKCRAGVSVVKGPPAKTEELKAFGTQCSKCRRPRIVETVRLAYVPGPPEHFNATCVRCGYSWKERCADGD